MMWRRNGRNDAGPWNRERRHRPAPDERIVQGAGGWTSELEGQRARCQMCRTI